MKKFLIILATSLLLNTAAQAELSILTVDMGELYNNYHRAKTAQDGFNVSVETAQKTIRTMIEEGRALAKEYQEKVALTNNPALTDAARQKAEEEAIALQDRIRLKEGEITGYKKETDQELSTRSQSIINLHLGEIREVVEQIAKEKNADFVMNINGGGLVYFKEQNNITEEVLKRLNADAPQG